MKTFKGLLAVLLVISTAGCKAEEKEIIDPAETEETMAELQEQTEKQEETSFLSGMLNGEWALTDRGIPEEDPDMILKIDTENEIMTLTRNSTQEAIMGSFEITDTEEEALSGLMKISFAHSNPVNQSVSIETDMYLRLSDPDGRSVLIMRKAGGNSTFMAEQFLKYERRTDDMVWVFERKQ